MAAADTPRDLAAALDQLARAGGTPPVGAIDALVAAGEPAMDPLLGLLAATDPDEDDWTPLWVAIALGELRSVRAVTPLLGLLGLPEGDVLAEAAVEALAKIGPAAVPDVAAFARDARGWEARHYAYMVVGLIPGDASLEFLLRAVDADPLLWSTIAIALADLGDPRAVPHLRRLLGRCNEREAESLREAIEILEGRQPPYPRLVRQPWRERWKGYVSA